MSAEYRIRRLVFVCVISAYLSAVFAIVVWGVTFASTRVLLEDFSALEILILRFGIAWAALWLWNVASRMRLCHCNKGDCGFPNGEAARAYGFRNELLFAGLGFTGVAAYQFLENCAIYYTNASNIAILVSFGPAVTAVVAKIFLKDKSLSLRFVLGSVIAMCGVACVSLNGIVVLELRPIGDLMALCAMLSWGVYSILVDVANRRGVPPAIAIRKAFFWSLVMIAPVAVWGATDSGFCAMDGSFSVNFNIVDNIERFSSVRNWANLAFLGVVASAAGFALWNCACKGLGVVKATALLYLVPVAGVVFAVGFLGESVAPMGIAGGALIIAGVAVTGRGIKKEVGE